MGVGSRMASLDSLMVIDLRVELGSEICVFEKAVTALNILYYDSLDH
jgi:hypothetical protein